MCPQVTARYREHYRGRACHRVMHVPGGLPGLGGECYHDAIVICTECGCPNALVCVQHAGERVRRVAQRVHNNRTLSQMLSFIVVTAFIMQIQIVMVSVAAML